MARKSTTAARFGHKLTYFGYDRYCLVHRYDPNEGKFSALPKLEAHQWAPGRVHAKLDSNRVVLRRLQARENHKPRPKHWVYVFAFEGADGSTSLFAELYIDADNRLHVNPRYYDTDRLGWSPELVDPGRDEMPELPHHVAGRPQYYSFVGVPFRLTDECLDKLTAWDKLAELADFVSLDTVLETDFVLERERKIPLENVVYRAPILFPFSVAQNLARDIRLARSKMATQLGAEGEVGKPTKKDIDGLEEYVFSKNVQALADHPKIGPKLENDLDPSLRPELDRSVLDFELRLKRWETQAEATGTELAQWYTRELFQILLDGWVDEDAATMLEIHDEIVAGLAQTAAGVMALSSFSDSDRAETLPGRMFVDAKKMTTRDFKAARSGIKGYVGSFTAYSRCRTIAHKDYSYSTMTALETMFSVIAPGWQSDFEVRKASIEQFVLRDELKSGKPGADLVRSDAKVIYAKQASLEKLDKALGVADLGVKVIDSVNFALALRDFLETQRSNDALRLKKGLAAAATGGALLAGVLETAFEAVGREKVPLAGRFGARALAFAAAAYYLVDDATNFTSAWQNRDYNAALAMSVSMVATLGSSVVTIAGAAGKGSVFGVLGAGLAVVGALAYVAYSYMKDEEIEKVLKFCHYGKSRNDIPAKLKAPWSPVSLAEFNATWHDQVRVLGVVQRQFAVGLGAKMTASVWNSGAGKHIEQPTPYRHLRLWVGYVDDGTVFELAWDWRGRDGNGSLPEPWGSRELAERLYVSGHGQLFADIPLPQPAMQDSGYASSGLHDLAVTVTVRKECDLGSTSIAIPVRGELEFAFDKKTSPDIQVNSIEVK